MSSSGRDGMGEGEKLIRVNMKDKYLINMIVCGCDEYKIAAEVENLCYKVCLLIFSSLIIIN